MPNTMHARQILTRADRRGFTLVELLVVIGVIAVLIAILMPALNRARVAAMSVGCQSNVRQILMGITAYMSDNGGLLPIDEMTVACVNTSYKNPNFNNAPVFPVRWMNLIGGWWDGTVWPPVRGGTEYVRYDNIQTSGQVWMCPFAGNRAENVIGYIDPYPSNYACHYGLNSYACGLWDGTEPHLRAPIEFSNGAPNWNDSVYWPPCPLCYNVKLNLFTKNVFPLIADSAADLNQGIMENFFLDTFNTPGTAPWPLDQNAHHSTYGKAIFHGGTVTYGFTDGHVEAIAGFPAIPSTPPVMSSPSIGLKQFIDPWMSAGQ